MSSAHITVYSPDGETLFELAVSNVIDQGRATDWLRQKGSIGTLQCRLQIAGHEHETETKRERGTERQQGDTLSYVESELDVIRGCIECPLAVVSAGMALMAAQSFGQVVIDLPDPSEHPLAPAIIGFWQQWGRSNISIASATDTTRTEFRAQAPGIQLQVRG